MCRKTGAARKPPSPEVHYQLICTTHHHNHYYGIQVVIVIDSSSEGSNSPQEEESGRSAVSPGSTLTLPRPSKGSTQTPTGRALPSLQVCYNLTCTTLNQHHCGLQSLPSGEWEIGCLPWWPGETEGTATAQQGTHPNPNPTTVQEGIYPNNPYWQGEGEGTTVPSGTLSPNLYNSESTPLWSTILPLRRRVGDRLFPLVARGNGGHSHSPARDPS